MADLNKNQSKSHGVDGRTANFHKGFNPRPRNPSFEKLSEARSDQRKRVKIASDASDLSVDSTQVELAEAYVSNLQ